jgi:hypothetical protein
MLADRSIADDSFKSLGDAQICPAMRSAAALRTDAVDVDVMGDFGELMLGGELAGAFFESHRGERHRATAASAYQVVAVLPATAKAIQRFAVFSALRFGDAVVGQGVQDAVHGGQPDSYARPLPYLQIDLLGASEALALAQDIEDEPLFGGVSTAWASWTRRGHRKPPFQQDVCSS